MKLKIGKLMVSITTSPCERQECTYYTHYLAWGPPDLSHEAFHQAEKACLKVQATAEKIQEEKGYYPDSIIKACEYWERRVRA